MEIKTVLLVVIAIATSVTAVLMYLNYRATEDCRTTLYGIQTGVWELKRLLPTAPVGNLATLVLGKAFGQSLQQSQQKDPIFASEVFKFISDGVCVCLSEQGFCDFRANVSGLTDVPFCIVCNAFRIEALGEGQAYYLVFDKGNDELYSFLTSKGALLGAQRVFS